MRFSSHSRRALLRRGVTVAGLGALGGFAGCQGLVSDDDTGRNRIGLVPSGARIVVDADIASLLSDSELRESIDGLLSEAGQQITVQQALDRAQATTGLDPAGVQESLWFSTFDGTPPWGTVVWADWSQSELFGTIRERGGDVRERTYEGATLLESADGSGQPFGVAAVDEGVFAAGHGDTIRSVVDLWAGGGEAVGGKVVDAYTATEGGYIQFAVDVPAEQFSSGWSGPIDYSALGNISTVYGSLTEARTLVVNIKTGTPQEARAVATVISTAKTRTLRSIEQTQSQPGLPAARQLLEATTVSEDGSTVVVRNEEGARAVGALLGAVVASYVLGLGEPRGPTAPQVSFAVEYDSTTSELRISHRAGDTVPASELTVRGEGVRSGNWADLGGTASGENDSRPAVVAGDTLTLSGVPPDYEVSIVWQSPDGSASATLLTDEGPDA